MNFKNGKSKDGKQERILINTKDTVPIKNQSLESYLYIIASPKTHKPELNSIMPKNASRFFLRFDFINNYS